MIRYGHCFSDDKPAADGSVPDDISQFYQQLDKDDDDDEATDLTANAAVAFEVDPDKIEVSCQSHHR